MVRRPGVFLAEPRREGGREDGIQDDVGEEQLSLYPTMVSCRRNMNAGVCATAEQQCDAPQCNPTGTLRGGTVLWEIRWL
jgi:hypothetical protein